MGRFESEVWVREHLLGGSMKARQKRHKCPKCGKYYVGYPALSREDNNTGGFVRNVGMIEAVIAFSGSNSNKN